MSEKLMKAVKARAGQLEIARQYADAQPMEAAIPHLVLAEKGRKGLAKWMEQKARDDIEGKTSPYRHVPKGTDPYEAHLLAKERRKMVIREFCRDYMARVERLKVKNPAALDMLGAKGLIPHKPQPKPAPKTAKGKGKGKGK